MERGGAATLEATRSWRGNGGAIYHPWEFRHDPGFFSGVAAAAYSRYMKSAVRGPLDQIPVIELGQRADFGSVDLGTRSHGPGSSRPRAC